MNALLHIKLKMGYMTPTVTETNVYDAKSDKLTSTSLNFGNAAIPVASITYDDLGRVKTRNSHGGNIRTSYTYDLHGWLTGLTATKANGSRLFQEDIHYADNSNPAINCYNGNISMVRWLSGDNPMGANICSGYTYTYDGLNRLTKATFGTGNIGQSGLSTNNDMGTVQYTYNANSSPTSLTRYGKKDVGYGIIDRLTYQYNGNQLKTITDTGSALHYDGAFEFSDANKAKLTQKVYDYDACGSMTYDPNRGITKIDYDLLGNPVRVQFCNGNVTEYVYSATGARLQTTYTTGISGVSSASTTIAKKQSITAKETLSKDVTYYMGNFIYTKDGLRYNFADGYTDGTTNGYHYYIRDHQGNNRVVANYDGTIEQTTHYYPYGGILSQSTNQGVQKYKYNGKEYDTMHGLNMYDYGARQQDPAVGMFTSMDPLCEKYYNISPYMYCAGNPVNYIDPTGEYIVFFDEANTRYQYDMDTNCFINANGEKYSGTMLQDWLSNLTKQLQILCNGHIGKSLVSNLANNSNASVQICISKNKNYESPTQNDNDNTIVSGVAFYGRSERPNGTPYASLAHELAHSTDRIAGTIKDDKETDLWLTDTGVTQSEIYATFIENQILKEHGQPLRSAYVYDKNGNPIDGRIIDNKERSLYFNKSGQHKDNFEKIKNSERFIF